MWPRADNHTIIIDTKFTFSLAVGQGSSQACNFVDPVNFFFRLRISRYVQNVVRKRAHLNVWSFDISAAEFAHQEKRASLSE